MAPNLQKKASDALVEQLLDSIGDARVLAPGARFSPLDGTFLGPLKQLLIDAFPNAPPELFHRVREDLIVIGRDLRPAKTGVVHFTASRLRVPKLTPEVRDQLDAYSALTNAKILGTRFLDADLHDCELVFGRDFFAPRSLESWARLANGFARQTAAWVALKKESGLATQGIETADHLIASHVECPEE